MDWKASDIPDLSGRTAVVTGASGGLGLESSRALAAAGADVVMAARDPDKARDAEANIRYALPNASLQILPLDLASLASIREASEKIAADHERVDILMNNAGVMGIPERRTEDGFEMQLGVNHLGHYVLTALLLPSLLAAATARIVTVTSTGHHFGRALDPGNPHLEGRYNPWRAYNQSKLANFHFALGLQRRFDAAELSARSLVAHPGLSHTELQATSVKETGGGLSQRFFHMLARSGGMSAERGALSQLRAATDPDAGGGEFYAPRFIVSGPPVRIPVLRRIGMDEAIGRMWQVSERETGVTVDLPYG